MTGFRTAVLAATFLLLALTAVAFAEEIKGSDRGEILEGTNRADTILGRGGNDRIFGGDGSDRIKGAAGEDLAPARRRVDLAKHGLGERGTPWWEQEEGERRHRCEDALEQLDELDRGGAST